MKAVFAYPPSGLINREDRCQVPTGKVPIAPSLPPTDLMYMAASAEASGAECRIIDCPSTGMDMNAFVEEIRLFMPDFLVISATTPTLSADLEACREVKRRAPGVTIIAKAAHFLEFDREVLGSHPEVDILVRNEPEPIIGRLFSGESLENIEGITWRKDDEIIRNPDAEFLQDLDSFSVPSRHLINNQIYVRPDNGRVQGIIKVSRGCPYNCFFCLATPVSGRRVRMRSPESILDEIRHCMNRYGMKDFIFWSDLFNFDDNWVRQVCESILRSGLRFTWASNMRADNINMETLKLMKRAGCSLISLGIESGSQQILDLIGKRVTIGTIRDAFGLIRKAGISSFGYFMIGFPWETEETAEDTIRFSRELRCDFANFFVATPFPGTSFYSYALQHGLFEADPGSEGLTFAGAYGSASVKGHHLGRTDIDRLYEKAVRDFYLRPGYVIRRIGKIRSFHELTAYSKAALSLRTSK